MSRKSSYRSTPAVDEALRVLAHCLVASEIEREIPSMTGFGEHYRDNTLTQRQRAIFAEFEKTVRQVRKDMAALLKEPD